MNPSKRTRILIHIAALIVAVCTLAPVLWLFLASVIPQRELIARPFSWVPQHLDFSRYTTILGNNSAGETFKQAGLTSIVVAVGTVIVSLVVATLGGYAIARLHFRLRRVLVRGMLLTYMLPQVALLVPLYFVLYSVRLLDTTLGLIIVDSALVVPFALWILSNYFVTLPVELEEAARVDGCSRLGAFVRVILPIATPGIVATAMFSFLLAWDEFMFALIFTSERAKTITVAISEFSGRYTSDFGLIAAGGLLAATPAIILAIVFQRYVVGGMASGAVK
ncbi:carbohydrate ABC transporter permease [Streptomyces avermitilis]|uniref:carbohydrate ABC transporter permease n=1 Tax=Streptomyces avermitilis TaxID=33903 RepID=UPI0037F3D2AF